MKKKRTRSKFAKKRRNEAEPKMPRRFALIIVVVIGLSFSILSFVHKANKADKKAKKLAKKHLKSAHEFLSQQKFAQALKEYQVAGEYHPDDYKALYFQGVCHSYLKNYSEAIRCYDQALTKDIQEESTRKNIEQKKNEATQRRNKSN